MIEKALVSLNKLIKSINESTDLKTTKEKCQKMEDLLPPLKSQKSYYLIYLAEVYAVKVHDLDKAEKLCQKIIEDSYK